MAESNVAIEEPKVANPSRRKLFGKFKSRPQTEPTPTNPPNIQKPEKRVTTRRELLIAGGTLGLAGLLSYFGLKKESPAKTPYLPDNPPPVYYPELPFRNLAKEIANLSIKSTNRETAETAYTERAKTLEQINEGLEVIQDPNLRADLIDKRWALRQDKEPGTKQLTDQEMTWLKKQGEKELHPELLAVAIEKREEAKQILQSKMDQMGKRKFLEMYRPDLINNIDFPQDLLEKITVDDLLISAGGMARIIWYETRSKSSNFQKPCYGLTNTGDRPAMEVWKENPAEKDALKELVARMNENKFVQYTTENIAGSFSGDIGLQLRPTTALQLHKDLKNDFGLDFNPFGIDSLIGAYILVGQGKAFRDGAKRYGYIRGSYTTHSQVHAQNLDIVKAIRQDGVAKWNDQAKKYIEEILEADENYLNEVEESSASYGLQQKAA